MLESHLGHFQSGFERVGVVVTSWRTAITVGEVSPFDVTHGVLPGRAGIEGFEVGEVVRPKGPRRPTICGLRA